MGAPDGFIDVVAAVEPIADGDADTPAHWTVTFGVDDIDATAKQAAELGGTVVVAPHDAPWTRTATLQDPQGAIFIAGQFVRRERRPDRGSATRRRASPAATAGAPGRRRDKLSRGGRAEDPLRAQRRDLPRVPAFGDGPLDIVEIESWVHHVEAFWRSRRSPGNAGAWRRSGA